MADYIIFTRIHYKIKFNIQRKWRIVVLQLKKKIPRAKITKECGRCNVFIQVFVFEKI